MPNLDKFPPRSPPRPGRAAALSQTFREAVKLGVKIGFGTDSGVSPHGKNAREFLLMAGRDDANRRPQGRDLRRRRAARPLQDDRHPEPGKLADIVAIPGDPMRTSRRPSASSS